MHCKWEGFLLLRHAEIVECHCKPASHQLTTVEKYKNKKVIKITSLVRVVITSIYDFGGTLRIYDF